jgi:hypothetical protein
VDFTLFVEAAIGVRYREDLFAICRLLFLPPNSLFTIRRRTCSPVEFRKSNLSSPKEEDDNIRSWSTYLTKNKESNIIENIALQSRLCLLKFFSICMYWKRLYRPSCLESFELSILAAPRPSKQIEPSY